MCRRFVDAFRREWGLRLPGLNYTYAPGPRLLGRLFNGRIDSASHVVREGRHGAGLRGYPSPPAVPGFVEGRQVCTAQQVVCHGGGESVACSDGVSHFDRIARVLVPFLA